MSKRTRSHSEHQDEDSSPPEDDNEHSASESHARQDTLFSWMDRSGGSVFMESEVTVEALMAQAEEVRARRQGSLCLIRTDCGTGV